jgi:hypothetical protein
LVGDKRGRPTVARRADANSIGTSEWWNFVRDSGMADQEVIDSSTLIP